MTVAVDVSGAGNNTPVSLNIWLQDILPRTPGLNRKIAKRELLLTVREFYEQSNGWYITTDQLDVPANENNYVFACADMKADVICILNAEIKGQRLYVLTRRPAGDEPTSQSAMSYWCPDPNVLRIWPTPLAAITAGLTAQLALAPTATATQLPAISQTHHYDAILDGLMGRVMGHPAKPYTNMVLAQYHLKRFRSAIGKYAGLAKQGYSNAQSWAYPRFGK